MRLAITIVSKDVKGRESAGGGEVGVGFLVEKIMFKFKLSRVRAGSFSVDFAGKDAVCAYGA
jgi:hypothetical protein